MLQKGTFPLARRLARHTASLALFPVWERAKASQREPWERELLGTAKRHILQPQRGVERDG